MITIKMLFVRFFVGEQRKKLGELPPGLAQATCPPTQTVWGYCRRPMAAPRAWEEY